MRRKVTATACDRPDSRWGSGKVNLHADGVSTDRGVGTQAGSANISRPRDMLMTTAITII